MGKRWIWLWLILLVPGVQAAVLENSVVQIFCFSQSPEWNAPWRLGRVNRGSGTGFVISGKRIMSNAHVVSWARQILVKRYQDPQPYRAQVKFIGHDCDLAILEVEDESFFDGMEPLAFGELPEVRSTVVTYGFPAGGEQISYTRGVVSRIELQDYVHIGNKAFLCVQTDAAINPGNSGGPVIQDDLVVGVAFMNQPGLENTGFIIPPPVVEHFLKDIEDGRYDGFPRAGMSLAPLQNGAYRQRLKLTNRTSGALIDQLLPIPATREVLEEEDVLLQVGPFPVGSDGSVIYKGNRVSAVAAFQEVQVGESLELKIWRDGEEKTVSLPMQAYERDQNQGNQYDVLPRYYVYGGLVFTPLSLDYFKTIERNWSGSTWADLVYELTWRDREAPEKARPEPIVLSMILAHPVNANFSITGRILVDKINGIRIDRLEDVIRAFETSSPAQHVIEFASQGSVECLDRAQAETANPEIMNTYQVPEDRRL